MSAQRKAVLQMLLCATLWSTGGIFLKLIPWNPFAIAGWRSLVAVITVLTYLLVGRKKIRFTRRSVLNGVFMSATFFAFVVANKLTTAANAIVLQFTSPVFIMVFSVFLFKKRFRRDDFLVVLFTLGGMALFFLDQLEAGYLAGNVIAIISGALLAGIYLTLEGEDEAAKMGGMLLGHLLTAAIGIPVSLTAETVVTAPAVLSLLALGIFQLGIPYILLIFSSRNCPPLACSILGAMEPLLNPVWVFLFNGEAPGVFALAGGVVVIVSVTLWCVRRDKLAQAAEAHST